MPIEAKAFTVTFYQRNDTQTINSQLGYILSDTQSTGGALYWQQNAVLDADVDINWDVVIRHLDGSETSIDTGVANYHNPASDGEWSATWSCPGATMVATDALKITGNITTVDGTTSRIFITEQLGWGGLNASTWTFYFAFTKGMLSPPPNTVWGNRVYHGDTTTDTRIEGIDYNLASGSYAFIMD